MSSVCAMIATKMKIQLKIDLDMLFMCGPSESHGGSVVSTASLQHCGPGFHICIEFTCSE